MAKSLTPERKAELKKAVLDSIDGTASAAPKTVATASVIKKSPTIKPTKTVVAKAATSAGVKPKKAVASTIKAVKKSASVAQPVIKEVNKPVKKVIKKPAVISDGNPIVDKIRKANAVSLKSTPAPSSTWDDNFFNSPKPVKKADIFTKKPARKSGRNLLAIILTIVIIVVAALALDIFGIYRLNWNDVASRKVASVLPLPAASVNGKNISVDAYLQDLNILQYALDNNREGVDPTGIVSDNKTAVLNRLIEIDLTKEQLAKYGKSVASKDLDNSMNTLITQFGGKDAAQTAVKKFYGINLDQFKTKVLVPLMDKDLLQSQIVNDDSLAVTGEAKQKANNVLNLATQPGVNFSELAKQYTDDEAGINTGGDLGYINKGELPADVEKALFALPDATVYNKAIKMGAGYHIFYVEKKLTDDKTGKQSIKVKQIFIKVDVDKYIKSLVDSAKITKYIQ